MIITQIVIHMTFLCPFIISIIVIDDKKYATILVYLFIPNQLYMFRAIFSPIIRSTWLYLQILVLSTDIAAGRCHGWDGTLVEVEAVNTVKCSW